MKYHMLLIFSFFENQTQRTKINNCLSNSSKIEYGVLQGSIIGPLFFNINLIDIYKRTNSDIQNYADGTTLYTCAPDTDTVISKLNFTSDNLFT